jgi:selenium metabolism protein YedF
VESVLPLLSEPSPSFLAKKGLFFYSISRRHFRELFMKTMDCRAQRCPHPVVETRKLILSQPGVPLQILVGDEMARENVSRLAASQGYAVAVSPVEGGFALDLRPGGEAIAPERGPAVSGKTIAFLASEEMGNGDPELGRILMKNLLFTMAEASAPPDGILFVNSGVKLTTEGSEVIEALENLACKGVDIASCGLCLDFYKLKDKLKAGRVTNMLEILETLQSAGRTIRP